jgi:hypothetical protein
MSQTGSYIEILLGKSEHFGQILRHRRLSTHEIQVLDGQTAESFLDFSCIQIPFWSGIGQSGFSRRTAAELVAACWAAKGAPVVVDCRKIMMFIVGDFVKCHYSFPSTVL